MTYIAAYDVLMNRPDLLKDIDNITIFTSTIKNIYKISEDNRNRDNIIKIKADKALKIIGSVYTKIFFSPYKDFEEYCETENLDALDNTTIITNNVLYWSYADYYKVKIQKYITYEPDYTGALTYTVDFDENGYNILLDDFLNGKQSDCDKCEKHENIENFFVIFKDKKDNSVNTILRYKNGQYHPIALSQQKIKNSYNTVSPRNAEQIMLFELLRDENIKILLTTGPFGTGKTFCLKNYAIEQLEKGKINKIIYVPNNSFNEDTRDIGALPGELFDKELIHLGSWIDLIGYDRLKDYVDRGLIELVPISIARGRSFDNSIIFVNEAQNLTDKHIKLLIGRCGDGTRIFFDGDIKQADSDVFRDRSGLRLLTKLRHSEKFATMFGMVKLKNIERSLTAQASAYLDEIE